MKGSHAVGDSRVRLTPAVANLAQRECLHRPVGYPITNAEPEGSGIVPKAVVVFDVLGGHVRLGAEVYVKYGLESAAGNLALHLVVVLHPTALAPLAKVHDPTDLIHKDEDEDEAPYYQPFAQLH